MDLKNTRCKLVTHLMSSLLIFEKVMYDISLELSGTHCNLLILDSIHPNLYEY